DGGAVELGEIGQELDVSSETVAEVVAKLCQAKAIVVVEDEDKESFVLARDPSTLALSLLADEFGEGRPPEGADPRVCALLHGLEEQRRRELAAHTLGDLLDAPSEELASGKAGIDWAAGERTARDEAASVASATSAAGASAPARSERVRSAR